jgi:hypothetical protein
VTQVTILPIDRSKAFDASEFIGPGWSIWRGPAEGDGLTGTEEQDERSLAVTVLDLTKIEDTLKSCRWDGVPYIDGEERLKSLKKEDCIRPDAQVLVTLWRNQRLVPRRIWGKTDDIRSYVYFDGTILRDPNGDRCVLYLCRRGRHWNWGFRFLSIGWGSATDWLSLLDFGPFIEE